jgi:hypothetical protein
MTSRPEERIWGISQPSALHHRTSELRRRGAPGSCERIVARECKIVHVCVVLFLKNPKGCLRFPQDEYNERWKAFCGIRQRPKAAHLAGYLYLPMFLTTATLSLARNSRELDLILQVSQENTDPSVGKQRIYCTTIASPVVAGSASSAFPEVARFVSINSAPSQNLKRRDERKAGYQTAEGLLWQFVPWHEDSSYALLRNHAHSDTAA